MAREQAAKIADIGIEVGDFINLDTWFGDIWAEVLSVYNAEEPSRSSVTYILYSKNRMMRGKVSATFGDIRKVLKAADREKTIGTFHASNGKYGGFHTSTVWPPVHDQTPYRGNGADHHQEKHPDWRPNA